jgi:hypothetical protein
MVKRNRKIAASEDNDEDEKKSSAINTHPSANRNPKKRKVEVENAMEVETSHTDGKDPFVYFSLLLDKEKQRWEISKAKVKPGDEIDDIRKKIKRETSPYFDGVPAIGIELFESDEHTEPLKSVVKWHSEVEWGTQTHPLIVKVNPSMVTVAPVNTGNSVAAVGKCHH